MLCETDQYNIFSVQCIDNTGIRKMDSISIVFEGDIPAIFLTTVSTQGTNDYSISALFLLKGTLFSHAIHVPLAVCMRVK